MVSYLSVTDAITFLVDFCYNAIYRAIGLGGVFNGIAIVLGFILIWKVIDNFVPKG